MDYGSDRRSAVLFGACLLKSYPYADGYFLSDRRNQAFLQNAHRSAPATYGAACLQTSGTLQQSAGHKVPPVRECTRSLLLLPAPGHATVCLLSIPFLHSHVQYLSV